MALSQARPKLDLVGRTKFVIDWGGTVKAWSRREAYAVRQTENGDLPADGLIH